MKSTLILIALLISSACFSQKDSTHKDSSAPKQDSVKTFAVILNENELGGLINLIKEADEKPSVINGWIQFLASRVQLVKAPKKEQPKK